MLHNYEMKVKNTFISYSFYTLSIIYAKFVPISFPSNKCETNGIKVLEDTRGKLRTLSSHDHRRVIYFTNIGVTVLHNYEMKVKNTFISDSFYTLSIIYA